MIVLDHAPDIKGGQTRLLGLMFEMNVLYERVVLKLLQQAVRNHPVVTISRHPEQHCFLGSSNDPTGHHYQTAWCTLPYRDTKWKLPKAGKPDPHDLKQMYAYNLQYKTRHSTLLYPGKGEWDTLLLTISN